MSNKPTARVVGTLPDGTILLEDPEALGAIAAVEAHNYHIHKKNCELTFSTQANRVQHFVSRIKERGDDPMNVVITLINVDDPHGGPLADILMPGINWQHFRDQGQVPYARGLAERQGIQNILGTIDSLAAKKLKNIQGIACVVVDWGVADVFPCC